jgi:DNA-binding transcriptional MerR regulator
MAISSGTVAEMRGYLSTGVVERLTGLSAHTLRAWERRYGIRPSARTATGQRAFTRADVERYQLLKQLLARGFRIGQIARSGSDELQALLATTEPPAEQAPQPQASWQRRIAVIGPFLATLLRGHERGFGRWSVDTHVDLDSFRRQPRQALHWLVAEQAHIDNGVVRDLLIAAGQCGDARLLLVYRYATQHQLNALREAGVVLVSYPERAEQLLQWLSDQSDDKGRVPAEEPLPPPRYSAEQLAQVLRCAPALQCECPRHLATIVGQLQGFEGYSQECGIEQPRDAALHARLHVLATRARLLMEEALDAVLEAERIDVTSH